MPAYKKRIPLIAGRATGHGFTTFGLSIWSASASDGWLFDNRTQGKTISGIFSGYKAVRVPE